MNVNYSRSVQALRDFCLTVQQGETVALTGPSGSGKTTVAWSILQVLPPGSVDSGSIRFEGLELRGQSPRVLRQLRGRSIACIPQQPALALHPLIRVGRQIEDVLRSHGLYSPRSHKQILDLFERMGLSGEHINTYPHQMSGGQLQRAAIAQAFLCSPRLLIADEPCAALDSVTRRDILNLFVEIKRSLSAGILLISHDRQVVSALADRVVNLQNRNAPETVYSRDHDCESS